MSYWKKFLFLSVFAVLSAAGSVNALTLDVVAPSHTQHIPKLKPMPVNSYQLASLQFLPDFTDSEFGWHGSTVPNDYSSKSDCSEVEYPLTECPAHGLCAQCNLVSMFKLTGCKSGYKKSDDAKSCELQDCTTLNSSYVNSVADGKRCTIVKENGITCYKDCVDVLCSDYSLTSCPTGAECEICPDCLANSTASGNCQPNKLKVKSCPNTAQKINARATACIDKSDVCETGFKEGDCETGISAQVGETEAGTPCYSCKAAVMNLPILFSDMTTSTELVSGKTPIGVVFDTNKKLALALGDFKVNWTDVFDMPVLTNNSSSSEASADWNGVDNTLTVWNYCQDNSKSCPAFEKVYNYTTAGTSKGDWYLPAFGELSAIYNNKSSISNLLSKVGAAPLAEDYYWSSSEMHSQAVWVQSFKDGNIANYYKSGVHHVRPVINYEGTKLPILYSDMTISKQVISGKTPIGVVFDADKKLAIALDEKVSVWFDNYYDVLDLKNWERNSTPAVTTDWNGKFNTQIIREFCQDKPNYCIIDDYVSSYRTTGTKAGDWYLPAMGELDEIYRNKDALNSTLLIIGGTELMLRKSYPENMLYWSSNEYNGPNAWAYDTLRGETTSAGKSLNGTFRPVIYYGKEQVAMPILYSDMTVSKELISGKTPIGVVFNEDKRLAVALEETNVLWSDQYFDIPGLTNYTSDSSAEKDWSGKNNTRTILTYCQSNAKSCPAAEYASLYMTSGTSSGDWYLPALGELKDIHNNRAYLKMTLEKIGGMPLSVTYWSSTEYDRTFAGYQLYVSSTHSSVIANNGKQNSQSVRPVIKYGSTISEGPLLPLPTTCGAGMRPLVCSGKDYCCPSSILNCDQMNSGTFKCFTSQDKVEL